MGITEDLADELATKALKAANAAGDQTIIDEIGKALGATSTTAHEAFLTAVRVRRAVHSGFKLLEDFEEKHK